MSTQPCSYVAATGDTPCGQPAERELNGRPLCGPHLAEIKDRQLQRARRERPFDPCPAGEPGVTDIGHGVRIRYTTHRGVTAGLIESHPRPDNGERCSGAVTFDLVETVHLEHRERWSVISRDPLTLKQSLRCRACGHHGHIRDGRWEPA